jgi:heat shock protein HtpX
MIAALRKIENRGELEGATSAVMEMCVDNPRSGFADLFATHPSIDARVGALVQFAGGHDPGALALPAAEETPALEQQTAEGPWGRRPQMPSGPRGEQAGSSP